MSLPWFRIGLERKELLRIVASLERGSEHPLAAAILAEATEKELALAPVSNFQSHPGQGAEGTVESRSVAAGNRQFMEKLQVMIPDVPDRYLGAGEAEIYVVVDGRFAGWIVVADAIKESSLQAIRELKTQGIRVVMLTGDNRHTAENVAAKLGISEFEAEVLPGQKAEIVRRLQGEGRIVAMAGDGINDAPALAQADVGIAMGTGTDVAMESGSVTLVKGELPGIVRARKLSQATMRNIRQNLFFAFVYNSLGVPLAAGRALSILRNSVEPHPGRCRDELQFGLGHHKFATPALGQALNFWRTSPAASRNLLAKCPSGRGHTA